MFVCSCCCGFNRHEKKPKLNLDSELNLPEDNSFFHNDGTRDFERASVARQTNSSSGSSTSKPETVKDMLTERTTFWGMVARDKIDGLYTYHIFDNPRYRDYFRMASRDETLTDAVVKILTAEYPGGNYRYRYLRDSESMCVHPDGVHVNWFLYFACPPCCSVLKPRCCRKAYDKSTLKRWDSMKDIKKSTLKQVVVEDGKKEEEKLDDVVDEVVDEKVEEEENNGGAMTTDQQQSSGAGIVLSGDEDAEEKKQDEGESSMRIISAEFQA